MVDAQSGNRWRTLTAPWRLESAQRAAANRHVAVSLRISLLLLVPIMLALPVSHIYLVQPPERAVVQGIALASAAIFAAIHALLRMGRIPDRHADAVGFLVVCVLVCLPTAHFLLNGAIRQSTNFALILCAAGCILLSPGWLLAAFAVTLGAWGAAVLQVRPAADWPHFALTLILAAILSGGLQLLHLVHLRRNETLQAQLEAGLAALGESEARHRQLGEAQRALIQSARIRESYLRCLTGISRLLLERDDPEGALPEVLGRLREVSGADRCYVFSCDAGEAAEGGGADEPRCTQRFESCGPEAAPQIDNPALRSVPMRGAGFGRWVDTLRRGGLISGEVADFPAAERALLEPQDIQRILVLPLHTHGRWWGFIGFDRCRPLPAWSDDDISLLQTAANLTGAAIARAETEALVRRQRAQMLEQAKNSLLWTMGSGVAHEINNPLAVISGASEGISAEIARGAPEPERLAVLSGRIARNVRRIAHIVRGLRTLSRDASDDPFETRPLRRIVEDALELCQARLRGRGIRLDLREIPESLALECRATQISQILINLLNNAFDAVADAEERWIRVEADGDADWVWFSVTDSGPGVGAAEIARLFEPFNTTKPPGRGMGVGLSISRTIATRHGGGITLDTGGAHPRFVVRLPRRQARRDGDY